MSEGRDSRTQSSRWLDPGCWREYSLWPIRLRRRRVSGVACDNTLFGYLVIALDAGEHLARRGPSAPAALTPGRWARLVGWVGRSVRLWHFAWYFALVAGLSLACWVLLMVLMVSGWQIR